MVRIVKRAEVRQDEILDVAQRLFMTRGYAETPIQTIIDEVGIAKGTFYHHYESKSDLLDALVRRMVTQSMALVDPIVLDTCMSAITKLNAIYQRSVAWKMDRRELLMNLARALTSDANVLLMRRIERDSEAQFVPRLAQVIAQGVRERVFDAAYPPHAAKVVYQLGMMFTSIRDALLDPSRPLPSVVEVHQQVEAFHDAAERVLGAPRGSIHLVNTADLIHWLDAESERRCS